MPQFNVQRIRYDAPNPPSAQAITAVGSLDNATVIVGNNRRQSGGLPATTATLSADDISGSASLSSTSTVAFTRPASGSAFDQRWDVQVLEYTGAASGPDEFLVRGRHGVFFNNSIYQVSVTVSGITDIKKCVPIITGIDCLEATGGGARATAYAEITSTTNMEVYIGGNIGRTTVYITIVEFTGSNWEVAHGFSGDVSADTGTIKLVEEADGVATGTSYSVPDWDKTMTFDQHRGDYASDSNEAIADNWPLIYPSVALDEIYWYFDANHDGVTNRQMVHVVYHPNLSVQRISDTQSLTGTMNVTIPSTLSDINQAMVMVGRVSSGTGAAYGRGWVNARLTSTSNVELWCHRSGNTILTSVQVIDFSGIVAAASSRRIFIS